MPTVYLMIGLPASGKSTYAKTLNLKILSTDDLIEKYAESVGKTYNEVFADYIGTASSIFDAQVKEAVANGESFVWDQTNLTRKKRASIVKQIPTHYDIIAVYVKVTDIAEHKRRLNSRVGKTIGRHVLISMVESMEEPHPSEYFSEIVYI